MLLDDWTDAVATGFDAARQWLFQTVVEPVLFRLGLAGLLEDAFRGTGWLLVGLVQVAVIVGVFGALQRWRPVEPVRDRAAVRVDILYTLLHRLGGFRLAMFFTIDPLWDAAVGQLRVAGLPAWSLEDLWPGVTDAPLLSFLMYLVVFDFIDYVYHRAEHAFAPWWQLHAVHHSQRQMTMWSDNRNHLLDDVLRDSVFVLAALVVGIAPTQFIAVVAATQLIESLAHANVNLSFGPVFDRVLVSPRYHRLHHAIGIGHESAGRGSLGGCNFAALLPLWDLLFGTARFDTAVQPTGIRDQLPGPGPGETGRDYGRGFWAQQRLGWQRFVAALRASEGRRRSKAV